MTRRSVIVLLSLMTLCTFPLAAEHAPNLAGVRQIAQPADEWPTIAKEQARRPVILRAECDLDCPFNDDPGAGCADGVACYNGCKSNKQCTLSHGCSDQTYSYCRKNYTNPDQPCTAC